MTPSRLAPFPLVLQAALLTIATLAAAEPAAPAAPATTPDQPDGSAEALQVMAGLRKPAELTIELFAAEPLLGNPVAIDVDEQGRVLVAEQYRFNRGTEENRTRPFLLDDDLQIATLDERLAVQRKFADRFEGGFDWFTRWTDQVRLVIDDDGDGRADRSTIFARGLHGPLDGLAAGVLARDGDVFLTCIPHLWRLRDTTGDGRADQQERLLTGFGVNFAFLGHDLHGLCFGPDGRLYFSVGDRGFHVRTQEGAVLAGPRHGAVFRCRPDGSRLEVLHVGLRNPQELAFDDFGNLFAADNNCDKGDHSRLVYVVEGGHSGWNMAYQTIAEPYLTGPWHAEKMWRIAADEQPAWITPPSGALGAGPSGFCHDVGWGLPERYRGHFLMGNYTGGGGIEAFTVAPRGAGFELRGYHDFLKPLQATDVCIGYDGRLFVSDYVRLAWEGGGGWGRIYTLHDPRERPGPLADEVSRLMREGFTNRPLDELTALLGHVDSRVRQRAHFALAARGAAALAPLTATLARDDKLLPRLHALWAVGMLADDGLPAALDAIANRLADADPELRAHAARLVGDHRHADSYRRLVELLHDESPRVRFFAAQSLGKLGRREAVDPLLALAADNADADAYLRHAVVVALERLDDREAAARRSRDPSAAVRLAVLLAQRRWGDARLADRLDDEDPRLVVEAARAINDLPLDAATARLAAWLPRATTTRGAAAPSEALLRRAIHANFRLGGPEQVQAVARAVLADWLPAALRHEALAALHDWAEPSPRDRVTGFWRPLAPRDPDLVREALAPFTPALLTATPADSQPLATAVVERYRLPADEATFVAWALDAEQPRAARVAALRLLAGRRHAETARCLDAALAAADAPLRAAAARLLLEFDRPRAVEHLLARLADREAATVERQAALELLAGCDEPPARAALEAWGGRLARGTAPAELELDIVEALASLDTDTARASLAEFQRRRAGDVLARHRLALVGGDAERGRAIFVGHSRGQCVRCHKVGGEGGVAGPDLSRVSATAERAHLLMSLVSPDTLIAPGFGVVTVALASGEVVSGVLKEESPERLTLELPDGRRRTIALAEIEERTEPRSTMPTMSEVLSLRELRDVVEYLSTLR